MFNFNAYCFCPEIISNRISDPEFFMDLILPTTVTSDHHVLLDSNEELWLEYLNRTKDDTNAFLNLKFWKTALDRKNNKILFSPTSTYNIVNSDFVSEVILNAPVTCHKYIVTSNNNAYSNQLNNFQTHGVNLLSEFNLMNTSNMTPQNINYSPDVFYIDIIKALEIISSTRANKLENEHNDFLRDLLRYKGYEIYDQSRLGTSATGLSIGNLDLILRYNNHWVTIIEPLRLLSIDSANIILHYNKLIDNYNPLRLPHSHLIVYYIGPSSNFNTFYLRYKSLVENLTTQDFSSDVNILSLNETEIPYSGIKSFIQQGTIDGHCFSCSHTCISFK